MTDLTQLLGDLSPEVSNVIAQVQAGNHAAVPDVQAHTAFSQTAGQLSPEQFQQAAADAYGQLSPSQRSQIAGYLLVAAKQQGINVPNLPSGSAAASDPGCPR